MAIAGLALLGSTALSTSAAAATGSLTNSPTTFATQAVASSNGNVTITGGAKYTSQTFSSTATPGTFLLTFTLPTGVTFVSTPTATADGTNFTAVSQSGGGASSNSVTYTVTIGASLTAVQGSVTLGAFQIAGANALSSTTASGAFLLSAQASGAGAGAVVSGAINDTKAATADLALSKNALSFAFNGAPNVLTINVASPSNGTKISSNGTSGTTGATSKVAFADLGQIDAKLNAAQNAAGTAQFTFTGTTLAVVATGSFTGVNAAYISPPGTTSCASTFAARPSGSIVGSLAANTITFNGVGTGFDTFGTTASQDVCLYFTGTTVISANPNGITITASVDTTSSAITGGVWAYDGVAQQIAYTGNSPNYLSFIRIVNNNAAPIQVNAVVQGDGGSTGQAVVESALAANSNDLVPASTIISSAGVTATNNRASMILLAPTGTSITQLVLNPNGTEVSIP